MFRSLILLALCRHAWTFKSPCTDDSHCDKNFYCETRAYQCLDCLRCEDFKRAAPLISTDCVKSVVECGPCTEGDKIFGSIDCQMNVKNVNDDKKNITYHNSPDIQLPIYAWVLIGIIIAVVLTVGFLLKGTIMNKMTTYSLVCRTSRPRSTTGEFPASAPEPPPAYHAVYEMESSELLLDTAKLEHESDMFIKPVKSTSTEENRESSDRQAAVPYNHPAYVRRTPMSSSNLPSTNGVVAENASMPNDDASGDISVVDGISGVAQEDIIPHATNNRTDTAGQSAYSNICTEPNSSQVIVVNNIVNLQAASISG